MELSYPVVLASASPRRRELLSTLVDRFEVVPADLDEDALAADDPWATAQRTAREKALLVASQRPDAVVVAGDTVVAIEGAEGWTLLAKPDDEDHAMAMLEALSGRTHVVVTGVCVVWPAGMSAFTETSRVTFRKTTEDERAAYVASGSPMDKAGAYGLQDGSMGFIERVEGDVDNVIGLPMTKLREALQSIR